MREGEHKDQMSISTFCPFQPQEAEKGDAAWTERGHVTPEKGQTCGHISIQDLDSGKDKISPETILQFCHLLYIPLIRTDFHKQFKLSAEWCSSEEYPTLGSIYTIFTMVPAFHLHSFPKSNKPNWPRVHFEWESGSIKANYFGKEARGFLTKQAQTRLSFAVNHFLLVPAYLWSPWNRSHPSQHI